MDRVYGYLSGFTNGSQFYKTFVFSYGKSYNLFSKPYTSDNAAAGTSKTELQKDRGNCWINAQKVFSTEDPSNKLLSTFLSLKITVK